MNPSRICFFAILSKDFRKLRSSDVLAILLIAYGHILPKLFEFFKLNIEIAQNIFCLFLIILENMAVSHENPSKSTDAFYFYGFFSDRRWFFFSFPVLPNGMPRQFFSKKMYLGTFLCLVRSLATIYIFARVRIIGTLVPGALTRSVFMYFITLKY